jgi:hypothetical protein
MTPTADDRKTRAGLGDERRADGDARDGSAPPAAPSGPTADEEEIRRRAYERYLARGAGEGNEVDDWLAAERELTELRAVRKLLHLPGRDAAEADGAVSPRPSERADAPRGEGSERGERAASSRASRARPHPPEQRA